MFRLGVEALLMSTRRWMALGILFGLAAGCATAPPVQEMSDARQAIASASEAGAADYAAAELEQARSALASAEHHLRSGTYWAARRAAIVAKDAAMSALLHTRAARDKAARPSPAVERK